MREEIQKDQNAKHRFSQIEQAQRILFPTQEKTLLLRAFYDQEATCNPVKKFNTNNELREDNLNLLNLVIGYLIT